MPLKVKKIHYRTWQDRCKTLEEERDKFVLEVEGFLAKLGCILDDATEIAKVNFKLIVAILMDKS